MYIDNNAMYIDNNAMYIDNNAKYKYVHVHLDLGKLYSRNTE